MEHQRTDLFVAVLHEYGNYTSQDSYETGPPNLTQLQPSLPRELAGGLQDEEFILCQILPSGRISTAENPRVDSESFNPCYYMYVGDLLDSFFGGSYKKMFPIQIRLGFCFLHFQILG